MVFEQRHEALSDHARSSENANLNLFGHNNLSLNDGTVFRLMHA